MKKEVKILGAIALVVIVGALVGASYYRKSVQKAPVGGGATNGSNLSAAFLETLVRPDSPALGAADAPVTIVEFLDPECESCAMFAPIVKKTLSQYDGKVRLVVRYMPLHPNSLRAAALTEAAGEQGKYWQMQELLFQKQPEWGTKHGHGAASAPQPDVDALFENYAMELGLDLAKINGAVQQNRYKAKLDRDLKDGQTLGVRQTPTVFVNGRKLARLNENDLRALIDEELKK
ncbi:MAG TPA: thioredoxin domain-containing protein [Pyrinomonadaceae bacterium]|jgi:protein-disulfide isomerase